MLLNLFNAPNPKFSGEGLLRSDNPKSAATFVDDVGELRIESDLRKREK